MKSYIFQFRQDVALRLGLKLNELLLLDYICDFIKSGAMKSKVIDGEMYYWISYKKIIDDLPILGIKDRTVRFWIHQLEKKGLLKSNLDSGKYFFLCVNFDALGGKILQGENEMVANFCKVPGKKLQAIDNYDIKKIKIYINNARASEIDSELFKSEFENEFKVYAGPIAYECGFKDKVEINHIGEDYIEFDIDTNNLALFVRLYKEHFIRAFDKAIENIVGEVE